MAINRRTAIKNLLILAPIGYVSKLPNITGEDKLLTINKQENANSTKHYINNHLINPREYPDDKRRFVKPPDWNTFSNETNFMTLRSFQIEGNKIVNYSKDLDIYTKVFHLGNVIWPNHGFLSADNVPALIDEFQRRGLFLFDIWGYVPGSGLTKLKYIPGSGGLGSWEQFKLSPKLSELFSSKLGDHWLGMDNGEQDGRYIGGYAIEMYPRSANRIHQYLNFQQHFEQLTDDLGNKMTTLVSLNFGHYFLKEGVYSLIGAETGEALPNGQVYYSFIRGAGKQYGVPWFGNSSGWNRWGYKSYNSSGEDHGPEKGTSLSLMKRLMYSHILYNSMMVGFDQGWFYEKKIKDFSRAKANNDALTPIGHIQQNAVKWVKKNGQPGVMYTPVALMLDFFAGWTFPRHLYSSDVYRVWGNLPYEPGDYLTDAVLNMIYPGYQNSSYYHDESGFICRTPYGDIADCVLSDTEDWILAQYPVLVIAGELSGGKEIYNKLQNYIKNGGHLIITSGNLNKFPEGLGNIKTNSANENIKAGLTVVAGNKKFTEEVSFNYYSLSFPENADILATTGNTPLAVRTGYGNGRITVLASTFGISNMNVIARGQNMKSEIDKPLPNPFPILNHVYAILDEEFSTQKLFDVGDSLSLITCCKGDGKYLLGIANNSWNEYPFNISSHCGKIGSIKEVALDQSEKTVIGYLPEGIDKKGIGVSGPNTIAGGDIRIFEIHVQEQNIVQTLPKIPPQRPRDRYLPLRSIRMVKNEILRRPTFFEHFDGVVLDWKYLAQKEESVLKQESGWIKRQKLKIIVDLTSGVDFFPKLRLIDNLHDAYTNSMAKIEDVLSKMSLFQAKEIILPLHRFPENNFTQEQTWNSFKETFISLCKISEKYDIHLNLRVRFGIPPYNLASAMEFIRNVGASNLKIALNTSVLLAEGSDLKSQWNQIKGKIGLWLISGSEKDIDGKYWNFSVPVSSSKERGKIFELITTDTEVPVALDAIYGTLDDEYLDAKALDHFFKDGPQ